MYYIRLDNVTPIREIADRANRLHYSMFWEEDILGVPLEKRIQDLESLKDFLQSVSVDFKINIGENILIGEFLNHLANSYGRELIKDEYLAQYYFNKSLQSVLGDSRREESFLAVAAYTDWNAYAENQVAANATSHVIDGELYWLHN